ncbi:hypothetical protein [Maribacter polysaccharolyticus]|uniref:hypothetical protein n=1 Tax=Maribacter polysaccharolyticus TaxID=3020831 RepID=UPI00237F1255|nr:hypothetical protein [Maribacter polysaccharolyticus]MDE3743136.1 hypothetical protein [Maribacter polysaccharolyticus]
MQSLSNFFKSLIKACPYSLVGKKCIGVVKGKPSTHEKSKNKALLFKAGIRTGRNISLVGVFCPFLWYAILSGSGMDFIILNLIHSGIIVLIGLVVLGINYTALYAYTKSNKKS